MDRQYLKYIVGLSILFNFAIRLFSLIFLSNNQLGGNIGVVMILLDSTKGVVRHTAFQGQSF